MWLALWPVWPPVEDDTWLLGQLEAWLPTVRQNGCKDQEADTQMYGWTPNLCRVPEALAVLVLEALAIVVGVGFTLPPMR